MYVRAIGENPNGIDTDPAASDGLRVGQMYLDLQPRARLPTSRLGIVRRATHL